MLTRPPSCVCVPKADRAAAKHAHDQQSSGPCGRSNTFSHFLPAHVAQLLLQVCLDLRFLEGLVPCGSSQPACAWQCQKREDWRAESPNISMSGGMLRFALSPLHRRLRPAVSVAWRSAARGARSNFRVPAPVVDGPPFSTTSSAPLLTTIHAYVSSVRKQLRLAAFDASPRDAVQAAVGPSGWRSVGLLDVAVAAQAMTRHGRGSLRGQETFEGMLAHAEHLLQALLDQPLKHWCMHRLAPVEVSALVTAGVREAPTPQALGHLIAGAAGIAGALNRLPDMLPRDLALYRALNSLLTRVCAPVSRSAASARAWREGVACQPEVMQHAVALAFRLVASGAWSDAAMAGLGGCLDTFIRRTAQRLQEHAARSTEASLPEFGLVDIGTAMEGAHVLCAAGAPNALSPAGWAGLLDLASHLQQTSVPAKLSSVTRQEVGSSAQQAWFGSAAASASVEDVWDVEDVRAASDGAESEVLGAWNDLLASTEPLGTAEDMALAKAAPLPQLPRVPSTAPAGAWSRLYSDTKPRTDPLTAARASAHHVLLFLQHVPLDNLAEVAVMARALSAQRCFGEAAQAQAGPGSSTPASQAALLEAARMAHLQPPHALALRDSAVAHTSAETSGARLAAQAMPQGRRRRPAHAHRTATAHAPCLAGGYPVAAVWQAPVRAAVELVHAGTHAQRRPDTAADLQWVAPHSPLHEERRRCRARQLASEATARQAAATPGVPQARALDYGVPLAALLGQAGGAAGPSQASQQLQLPKVSRRSWKALGTPGTPRQLHHAPPPAVCAVDCAALPAIGDSARDASQPSLLTPLAPPAAPSSSALGLQREAALQAGRSAAQTSLAGWTAALPPAVGKDVASTGLESAEVAFLAERARVLEPFTALRRRVQLAQGLHVVSLPVDAWRSISARRRAAYLRMLLPDALHGSGHKH